MGFSEDVTHCVSWLSAFLQALDNRWNIQPGFVISGVVKAELF
jgi:hypothetical protein